MSTQETHTLVLPEAIPERSIFPLSHFMEKSQEWTKLPSEASSIGIVLIISLCSMLCLLHVQTCSWDIRTQSRSLSQCRGGYLGAHLLYDQGICPEEDLSFPYSTGGKHEA